MSSSSRAKLILKLCAISASVPRPCGPRGTLSVSRVLDQARRRARPFALPALEHDLPGALSPLEKFVERIEQDRLPGGTASLETCACDAGERACEREHRARQRVCGESAPRHVEGDCG